MSDEFLRASERLIRWCADEALPFWASHSLDPSGGYYEALAMNGTPLKDRERRVRVQPRQAYVFAHAAALGWMNKAKADTLSRHGFDYMLTRASADGKAGWAHRLGPDHQITVDLRDTYDHAFVILASAWRAKAFGDDTALQVANEALAFADMHLREADASYREGLPASLPRRQNPHMHLFEAMMALSDVTKNDADIERTHQLFHLFKNRFFDGENDVVREFFTENWSIDADRGTIVEPGHLVEWCWLLSEYEQQFGISVRTIAEPLYEKAVAVGRSPDSETLIDTTQLGAGLPASFTRRTWVQTEYLKGTCAMIKWGRLDLLPRATRIIEQMLSTYLSAEVPGGYFDQYNDRGEVTATDMPTSTLYHLMSAAAEVDCTAKALSA